MIHVEFAIAIAMGVAPFFARVEKTAVASTIAQSVVLTGTLSGAHLVGFTLLMEVAKRVISRSRQ